MTKATDQDIAKALGKHDGVMTHTAKALGMSRQGLYERVNKSDRLKALIREIDEELLDYVDGHIAKGVKDGDKEYVRMVAHSRRAAKRGWGNRIEVGLPESQAEAIVGAIGGDVGKLRALLAELGCPSDEIP